MKGGCEIGKKSGAGGCKTGKKKKKGPATKPKTGATKLKGLKFKLETKRKELVKLQEMKKKRDDAKPKPKIKFKVVKKEVKKPIKKKIKFKIKPAELPELKAITGLTKAQANKLDPAVLFGMLPKELAKDIVLKPSVTGVKVAQQMLSETELKDKIMEILKINNPRIRIDSGNAKTKGNKILTDALKTAKFKRPRNMDWRNFGVLRTEKAFSKPEKARSLLNNLKSQLLTTKSIKAKK